MKRHIVVAGTVALGLLLALGAVLTTRWIAYAQEALTGTRAPTATLRGSTLIAQGGTNATAIENYGADTYLEAMDVTVVAENGNYNKGLENEQEAKAAFYSSSLTARGGTDAIGIDNSYGGAFLTLERVTVLAQGASDENYGLRNVNDAQASVDSCHLTGDDDGLYQSGGTVQVGLSQLSGGAARSAGTLACFQTYDESYSGYSCP